VAAIVVVAMIVWQGLAAHGAPDPTQPNTSPTVAFLDIGILVFRGDSNAFSFSRPSREHDRRETRASPAVAVGAGVAFIASLITWFVAVRIVSSLSDNVPALDLQAATGLLAVIVLLVIMNCSSTGFIGAAGFVRIIVAAKHCSKAQRKWNYALAPLVGTNPAWLHFALSRGIRGCPLPAKLLFATGGAWS